MKIIKRIISFLSILILLFVAGGIIFAYYNEDKVTAYMVREMNKQLKSEVSAGKMEFSVLRKFPYASLILSDVVIKDATNRAKKDTLLKAEKIYLNFSVIDFLYKKYNINTVDLENGTIAVRIFSDNTDNYHFWGKPKGENDNSFSINLKKVGLSNIDILYRSYKSSLNHSFTAKDAKISGSISNKEMLLRIKGDVFVKHIIYKKQNYARNKDANVNMLLHVDRKALKYTFTKAHTNINGIPFTFEGSVVYSKTQKLLDLSVQSKEVNLSSFLKQLPENYQSDFKDYNTNGYIALDTKIKGSFAGTSLPLIESDFSLRDAEIQNKETTTAFQNINLTAFFSNGSLRNKKTYLLDIPKFSAQLEAGDISGRIKIEDFIKPKTEVLITADLALENVQEFLPLDTIEELRGHSKLKMLFKGNLSSLDKFSSHDFINSTSSGEVVLSEVSIKLKNNPRHFTDINGLFHFNNNDIKIDDLAGSFANNTFSAKGYLRNVLSYLFVANQKLIINADITAPSIALDNLLIENPTASNKEDDAEIRFSDNIFLNLKVNIANLSFGKFKARNLSGDISYKNKKLFAKKIHLDAVDGKITAKGILDATRRNKIVCGLEADIEKVDANKLFYQFDNFGQDNLKDENLRGILSSKIHFTGILKPNLQFNPKSIKSNADIVIEDGELIDYNPMYQLSKYLDVNELSHIKFSRLENTITIKDEIITIPSIQINSNAINLKAYGTHTFSNKIDYHLTVLLSEIISNRKRKEKNTTISKFGEIEESDTKPITLYVLVSGTVDDPSYKMDGAIIKENIKNRMKEEKQTIKKILHDEFNLFKKDTSINQTKKEEKSNNPFKLIWDEEKEDKKTTAPAKDSIKKPAKSKYKVSWDG